MSMTLFYAWQSDRDERLCHYLIRDAANDAIDKLMASVEVEEAPAFDVELDHDRKGVPGQPHIAETISEKISRCTLFIADLTHVGDYATFDGRKKKSQNPNVLIELGLARKHLPLDRMLFVMNIAYGGPEDLPFDLKYLAHPIHYELSDASDRVKVKAEQRKLSSIIAEHLTAMLKSVSQSAEHKREANNAELISHAEDRWSEFEKTLQTEARYDVLARPRAALAIIPLKPLEKRINLHVDEGQITNELLPIGTISGWSSDHYGRSIVIHNGSSARARGTKQLPSTLVELTDDGSIFAVHMLFLTDTATSGTSQLFGFQGIENQWFQSASRFVKFLRSRNLACSLLLKIGLFGVKGSCPVVDDYSAFRYAYVPRPLTMDKLILDSVILSEQERGQSIEHIAEALQPAIKFVWRETGLPGDPLFDQEGRIKRR